MVVVLLVVAWVLAVSTPAQAYIGPGAGFAVLSSFLVVFTTILVAIASVLIWPFRALWHLIRRDGPPPAAVRRLVIVGFDGQDPTLTDRFMKEGELPNFSRLAKTGSYHRLRTTFPSVSPVAWSSFSTGIEASALALLLILPAVCVSAFVAGSVGPRWRADGASCPIVSCAASMKLRRNWR